MRVDQISVELCSLFQEKIIDLLYKSFKEDVDLESSDLEIANSSFNRLYIHLREKSSVCYGAFENDKLIGLIWACKQPFRDEKNRLYIELLFVEEEYRGRHIGRELVEVVFEYAKVHRYNALYFNVDADNVNAIRFFKSFGFELERIQLVKTVDASPIVCKDVYSLDADCLKQNIDAFSALFLQNIKAHLFTSSFDYQYAYSKMTDLCDYLMKDKAYCYYIKDNKSIIGFIWGYPSSYKEIDRILIAAVQVFDGYRSKGYGKILMDAMQTIAYKKGIRYIYTHTDGVNHRAQDYYHKLGFIDEEYQFATIRMHGCENEG